MDNQDIDPTEILCPACGAVFTEKERTNEGWNCTCGEFIPESLAIKPLEGLSNQHKQNKIWR
jgi:hypothetical protein